MDTSSHDLPLEFFIPLLSNSTNYDRGVGFFSSSWLRVNAQGMVTFANNGGRARWVTSPILSSSDWEALLTGDAARRDPILRRSLDQSITDLATTLERDTLSALAWMVADNIITFKLALPYDKLERGDFHDKFGIFTDLQGNQVSFNGSYNDSIHGLRNYESIKIFSSWEAPFAHLVQADVLRFNRLWDNADPNVKVFDLPDAAREKILRLRSGDRPYTEPKWIKLHRVREKSYSYQTPYRSPQPRIPEYIALRDYQEEAISAWFNHQQQGLLEMATGTGKTITALAASVRLYKENKRLAVVISVPYQHLVDQWNKDAIAFGYRPILAYKSKNNWFTELKQQITEYNAGYRSFFVVITTHTTFATPDFQESLLHLQGHSILIADEAHHLGAEHSRENYPNNIFARLALSATPDRWFDDEGTAALRAYFGETVFTFPIEKAIGVCLTPYYYYPHLVPLTDEEFEQYQKLSARIVRLAHSKNIQKQQVLERLFIQRARLLNGAANKLSVLNELVDKQNHIVHTLFYCSPEQIESVLHLLGRQKGLLVHRFAAQENTKERQKLLMAFAQKELQGLVAMKCLDEGVDIPSTRIAYILASSSNPREFIQRRGRILRQAPGKDFSIIHDLITLPPTLDSTTRDSPTFEIERGIVRRELQRFNEFAGLARNKHQALDVIWGIAKSFGLMDF